MKVYVAVGVGGIIGSSFRYLLSLLFLSKNFSGFTWGTLIANLTGAFLLTFILFYPYTKFKWNPTIFTALTTGVIGSYTTFSTITLEVVFLAKENLLLMIVYLLLTIVGGLLSSFVGFQTVRNIEKKKSV